MCCIVRVSNREMVVDPAVLSGASNAVRMIPRLHLGWKAPGQSDWCDGVT